MAGYRTALLDWLDGQEIARVTAATCSPDRPLSPAAAAQKRTELSGTRLDGALGDPERPATEILDVVLRDRG